MYTEEDAIGFINSNIDIFHRVFHNYVNCFSAVST